MKVQVLASGSKGNCTIVLGDNVNLIIDMGIPYLTLKRRLEEDLLSFEDFAGILITHNHKDHIKGLKSIVKEYNPSVYSRNDEVIKKNICNINYFNEPYKLEDLEISFTGTSL